MKNNVIVGLVVLALGCSVASERDESAAIELADDEVSTLEIVENLRRAGYPDEEIEVREGGVVFVGGDAEVSLEASREMIGLTASGEGDEDTDFRQYRTNNFVSTTHDTICINGAAFTGTLSTALDNAIANYTNLSLSFNLVRTNGAAAGCDATINAVVVNGTGGSAGFPSGGLPFGTINIGDDIVASYGLAAATHVITHELGHCVGFRHSDYYNRSISCGVGGNEGDAGVGAVLIPGTPATAVYDGSVMNSCYNAGSTGQWTASDNTALHTLYGIPNIPSPLVKYSESCFGFNTITWSYQPLATVYELYRATSAGFATSELIYSGNETETSIDVTSGIWSLRARACNNWGCSDWTNKVSASRVNYCL